MIGAGAGLRRARLARAFFAGAPIHCTWQLTPRCESFCHLCEHRAEAESQELDAEACARIADALGGSGALLVSFTGSEPFLRADLPQVIAAVARRHFPLLVTNGWLVEEAGAQAVWRAGLEVATVALEHAEAEGHDARSGLGGSHARALAALERLSQQRTRRGQRVNVRVRLREAADIEGLPGLAQRVARHQATLTVEPAYPLAALDGESRALAARLVQLKRRHSQVRTDVSVIERLGQAWRGGVPGCLAGRAFFNVDHRGHVSRCLEVRPPAEDLGSAQELGWRELRAGLRQRTAGNDCRACYYASRAEVEALFTVRGLLGGLRTLVSP
jgi:MoaA/NifB/PqqE/SkfB family radical SAM enzyme